MYLAEQVAIVTGGSRGIGQAICLTLARLGATVVAAARNKDRTRSWVAAAGDGMQRIVPTVLDVTNREQVNAVIEEVAGRYGRLEGMDRVIKEGLAV